MRCPTLIEWDNDVPDWPVLAAEAGSGCPPAGTRSDEPAGLFARALLDPEAEVPWGLTDPEGRPAPKRFSVYRNNVASSLTRALEAAFPTVRKLVGDEFFAAMAGVFLRAHPPQSRMLMLYGDADAGLS